MVEGNPQEGGYVPQQYPQSQTPPTQYYQRPRSLEETLVSNIMLFIVIFFGFIMIFIGKIILMFATGDATKAGSIIMALGTFVMASILLFAMLVRNDINRWVRVSVIIFVTVLTIYLLGASMSIGFGNLP